MAFAPFTDDSAVPAIYGLLHQPDYPNGNAIALTHGAGGNCRAKLLVAVSDALADIGFTVLRFDLPFRLARPFGPPNPGTAAQDRQGLRRAAALLRAKFPSTTGDRHQPALTKEESGPTHEALALTKEGSRPRTSAHRPSCVAPGRVFLGGHSYGGRQASMLLAEAPDAADGLLLLSYPLHPPNKPTELRTQHFPQLTQPAYFVHGTRDPFATSAELQSALALIPAPRAVLELENAAHDLLGKSTSSEIPDRIAQDFERFLARLPIL
jgi:uncharacterized protein